MIHQISDYAKYMELINEAYTNTGQAAKFSQSTIDEWREAAKNPNAVNAEGIPNYVTHPNTDWRDVMYNNHWMMEHTVTVSGAEKRTTYSLSGTYLDNPGLVINSGLKKYYFRSDVESRPKDFLTVGLRAWGYKADHQRNDVDGLYGFMMEKTVPGVYPSLVSPPALPTSRHHLVPDLYTDIQYPRDIRPWRHIPESSQSFPCRPWQFPDTQCVHRDRYSQDSTLVDRCM